MTLLTCARCGRRERRSVAWGYPSPEMLQEAQRGKVVLAGCCVDEPVFGWLCDPCSEQVPWWERLRYAERERRAYEELHPEIYRRPAPPLRRRGRLRRWFGRAL
jgi:hypothetical protein